MTILARNNVRLLGKPEDPVLIFGHGFGCSQHMWDSVSSAFADTTYQILFDYVGSGQSDLRCFDFERYADLSGYAQDVIEICDAIGIERDVIFIGHSVSCSIGILAANARPNLFSQMILLGPSPCFLNMPPDYFGGFEHADLEGLLDLMNQNYMGWAEYLAPVVIGADNDTELVGELSDSFCSTDPVIAQHFARATFFADNRKDFANLQIPSLILQHKNDALAPEAVGHFVHNQLPNSQLQILDVTGHAAHMSHPHLVVAAIKQYLELRNIL